MCIKRLMPLNGRKVAAESNYFGTLISGGLIEDDRLMGGRLMEKIDFPLLKGKRGDPCISRYPAVCEQALWGLWRGVWRGSGGEV